MFAKLRLKALSTILLVLIVLTAFLMSVGENK